MIDVPYRDDDQRLGGNDAPYKILHFPPTHECPDCGAMGWFTDFKHGCYQCGLKLKGKK